MLVVPMTPGPNLKHTRFWDVMDTRSVVVLVFAAYLRYVDHILVCLLRLVGSHRYRLYHPPVCWLWIVNEDPLRVA